MKQELFVCENGIYAVFAMEEGKPVYFLHFGNRPVNIDDIASYQLEKFYLVQIQTVGSDHAEHHGSKHCGTVPGKNLCFQNYEDKRNMYGRELVFYQTANEVEVESHIQFYDEIACARFWNVVKNDGKEEIILEYVSSFALMGIGKEGLLPWDEKLLLHIPHNTWAGENQWRKSSLRDLGLSRVEGKNGIPDPQSMQNFSMKRICITSEGTWGCSEYLPMGVLENLESENTMAWQIESHSAWHCEISDNSGQLYLQLSGPTGTEHQWYKNIKSGESFSTVEVAISVGASFGEVISSLTKYRRKTRRDNKDDRELPVIFNDYMNCLYGQPTTEKLLPLIDAASEAGCEYFCIDAGWYADGEWWDEVGEWLPSSKRFPGGMEEPIAYIRKKGMIPGLWVELEVMGINCPLAKTLPDSWFFMRFGKRVIDHGRYQLDYRNPEVRAYAKGIIQRLAEQYNVGYIKIDYNINAGPGTDFQAFSAGDGLLEHERAYLLWLKSILKQYPQLVIENCSSGGMRMAYSLLSLCSVQSVSDQIDYQKMAVIASAAPASVTPEQAAIWSYPTEHSDMEEIACNMINAILLRVHQSGHLGCLKKSQFEMVKKGISVYKRIRKNIASGIPFWPLGMSVFEDEWAVLGLEIPGETQTAYLAVWHLRPGTSMKCIPLKKWKGKKADIVCMYPDKLYCGCKWNSFSGCLSVELPNRTSARLFCIKEVEKA